jgi:SPX domain protein involved in polyphosphate accumulation
MIDEFSGIPKNEKNEIANWYRDMEQPLPYNSIIKFPFAPKWVNDLIESGSLFYAERFSKFLYGTIQLRPEKIKMIPYSYKKILITNNSLIDWEIPKAPTPEEWSPNLSNQHQYKNNKLLN